MVDKFTYLGCTLPRVVHIDDEVNVRIAKASAAFGQLSSSVWDRSGIRLDTKLKVYRAVVLPTVFMHAKRGQFKLKFGTFVEPIHTSMLAQKGCGQWNSTCTMRRQTFNK